MKHDLFEFNMEDMTWSDRAWRIAVLLFCIGALAYDLWVGRPG